MGLILTLGLFLILGTSPVGAAEETSGEFLERCLGKVEEIKGSDTEAGIGLSRCMGGSVPAHVINGGRRTTMRTRAIWIGVVLVLGVCGLVVSQALSLERWVDTSRLGAPPALAQETRPPASPVLRSRFGRVVPPGWSAPRLVEEPARPDQAVLTRVGLPSAHAADVALAPVAGLSLVEAAGVGPWPRPIPVAASVMQYRPALGQAVAPEDCADAKPIQRILASMPDKCDDKLWGRWMCGQSYWSDGTAGEYTGTEYTFSRTIGEGGYEHVRLSERDPRGKSIYDKTEEWKVDEKWHPLPRGGGRLSAATCDGQNEQGYRILAVYEKNPDGSARTMVEYYVDSEGVGWEEKYKVWWKGGKMYEKKLDRTRCNRET